VKLVNYRLRREGQEKGKKGRGTEVKGGDKTGIRAKKNSCHYEKSAQKTVREQKKSKNACLGTE